MLIPALVFLLLTFVSRCCEPFYECQSQSNTRKYDFLVRFQI